MSKFKLTIIIAIILTTILAIAFIFMPHLIINDPKVTINYQEKYKDSGYQAKSLIHDYHDEVTINGNVNPNKIGTYKVTYQLKFLFMTMTKEKIVTVADQEQPIITLNGNNEVNVCPGKTYQEEGYTVTDNLDENLQDQVQTITYEDEIIYKVKDKSGNLGKTTRKIIYQDKEQPTINLEGSNPLTIYVGSTYNEPGYQVIDNCDDNLTEKVEVTNNINTSQVGSYEVIYKVVDNANNETTIKREVKVINKPVTTGGNGVIYLTFDDGPSSSITPAVLDILKEEGVKATFFVTGKSPSLDYLLQREYNEGHTVALHTNTHNYASVYASVDAYFNDLYAIQNHVKSVTGITSNIIRFPGGSSNTISRNYCPGIMTRLVSEVESRGFIYFDWNVDSDDAGSAQNQSQVYNNVTSHLSHYRTNIVLMHDYDNNYKTLNALRDIIHYGKNNGYSFSNITDKTPPSHHGVNN